LSVIVGRGAAEDEGRGRAAGFADGPSIATGRHDRWDAIVIGAGHNGLVHAAYLARAGLKVLVLERRHLIGGAAVSEELYPGFTYTTCSYVSSLLRPQIIRELDLPAHGLQIIPYVGTTAIARSGEHFAMYGDHDRTRREIARLSARDMEGYERFSAEVTRQCRFVRPLLMTTPPDPTSFRPRDLKGIFDLGRAFAGLGETQMLDTIRFWTMSCADFLDQYFEHDLIKAMMAGSSIIGTALGPASPGSAYVLLHHYMGEVDGALGAWGFARGGMGAVSNAIAGAARAAGAVILTEAPVERILIEGGRARGVALANGDVHLAPIVVSNLDPKKTWLSLVEPGELPADFVDAVRRFKTRGSSGKLNIALGGLPRFTAMPDDMLLRQGDVYLADSMDYLERGYDDWKRGTWSQEPFLDIVVPSVLDPTLAPSGKHMMSVFVQWVPPRLADGPWTPEKRDAFGECVLDTIERHAPGFRSLVLHAQVRTPWDIENEVGLSEGNIFQGELTFDQLLFNRPVPGYAQYRGPVKGVYMCGSATHPGGGVMGAPGFNAAREVLADVKARVA
jgi:phytoene dehydrogenase-like protein